MTYLKAFAAAAVVFLLIDIAWISLFLGDVYEKQLGSMMRSAPAVGGAALFYVGYLGGVLFFAAPKHKTVATRNYGVRANLTTKDTKDSKVQTIEAFLPLARRLRFGDPRDPGAP